MTIGKIAKLMLLSALFLIPFASMADRTEREKLTVSNNFVVTQTATLHQIFGDGYGITNEPLNSGFDNQYVPSISFTAQLPDRTLTLSPNDGLSKVVNYGHWIYITNNLSTMIPDSEGMHFIYFDSGDNLTNSQTSWTINGEAQVAIIYWDSTNNRSILFADERHRDSMSDATHKYLHSTLGSKWSSGFALSHNRLTSGLANGNGSNTCVSIDGGTIFDEDLQIVIETNNNSYGTSPLLNTNQAALLPVLYSLGDATNTYWRLKTGTYFPFLWNSANNAAQYNAFAGGVWTTNDVTDNRYFVYWIFATDSLTNNIVAIPHHTIYTTLALAQSGATPETIFQNRSSKLPLAEIKVIYRLIWYFRSTTAAANPASVMYSRLNDVVDYRMDTTRPLNNAPTAYHGALAGLGNDDHSQYVIGDGSRASTAINLNGTIFDGTTNVSSGGSTVGYNAMLAGSSVGSTTLQTNTVSFASAFGYTPYVIVGWMDSTLNQVATPQVISRSSSNFLWVIRNSEGMISTNWTINWIATDTQILSSSNLISLQNFTSDRVPIGSIEMWGSLTAPNGWFLCDGSAVSRSTYSNLFSVISTNFGVGDGSTTFTLPDLRNRFAYGVSTGLGMTGGVSSVTLTSNQIPPHSHSYVAAHATGGTQSQSGGDWTYSTWPSGEAGGGQAHTNMPPYQSVSFIIKHSDVLQTTAQEALPISGTIPMSGTLTVPNIKITNGATNGAVWVATNSAGEGIWSKPIAFRKAMASDFQFTGTYNAKTTIAWDTETYDYGNRASTTNFVAPVNGLYRFTLNVYWSRVSGAATFQLPEITVDGLGIEGTSIYNTQAAILAGAYCVSSGDIYMTNGAIAKCVIGGDIGTTNKLNGNIRVNSWTGTLIRELP